MERHARLMLAESEYQPEVEPTSTFQNRAFSPEEFVSVQLG